MSVGQQHVRSSETARRRARPSLTGASVRSARSTVSPPALTPARCRPRDPLVLGAQQLRPTRLGRHNDRLSPGQVASKRVVHALGRGDHTAPRKLDDTVWCWGDTARGSSATECGRKTSTPVGSVFSDPVVTIDSVTTGAEQTCALKTEFTRLVLGRQSQGQSATARSRVARSRSRSSRTWRRSRPVAPTPVCSTLDKPRSGAGATARRDSCGDARRLRDLPPGRLCPASDLRSGVASLLNVST